MTQDEVIEMPNWLNFKMTPQRHEGWSKTRKRGAAFYVFIWGVLYYGGLMFTARLCWEHFADHKDLETGFVLRQAIAWIVIGLFWGMLTWALTENQFEKFEATQNLYPTNGQVS
jgi:hypothetical protein